MSKPNVLLIVLDAVRKDHLSVYGYERETTPNLSDFASDCTVYHQAISTSAWTPPAHASMFTGKYPSFHRAFGEQSLPADQPTVAELLSNHGYATAGFSNSFHTSRQRGFDRGYEHYHDIQELRSFGGWTYELSFDFLRFAIEYFKNELDISYFQLEKLQSKLMDGSRPFMAFLNMNSGHSPYSPPPNFNQFEDDVIDDLDLGLARHLASRGGYDYMAGEIQVDREYWRLLKQWYDGEIRYMDELLGKLMDFLKQIGEYNETLIIVTSDHGEHFGEHGLAYHQFSLSEILINVPLLVKWPDGLVHRDSQKLISLTDFAPTMLSLAGIDPPDEMQGIDIRADRTHDAVFAEYIPYSGVRDRIKRYDGNVNDLLVGLQAIRTDKQKLVRTTEDEEILFDVSSSKENELRDDPLKRKLSESLAASLPELEIHPESGEELSDDVKSHLRDMGYM